MTKVKGCPDGHQWTNSPDFEDGIVMVEFAGQPEMRQYCESCGDVRYIAK